MQTKETPAIEGGSPVRTKFLSFSTPDVQPQDIQAATEVMESGWLSTGKKATEFEKNFAQYKGGKVEAVALSSCTAALHLALLSLNLQPGDEIITTDFTFSATVATIIHAGGTPVIVDCTLNEQCISGAEIEKNITPRTKAVIVVHFAGYPCAMRFIEELCNARGIPIIEDCAHAIESMYNGVPCGTNNYAGCFSFYGTKNITTAVGEGGMLVSKHPEVIAFARTMSLHGMSKNAADRYSDSGFKHYDILAPGFKYNMPDVSAAFCNSQLQRIEYNRSIRESIWDRYNEAFDDLPVFTPFSVPLEDRHAYHLYTIQIVEARFTANRDHILDALTKEGIGVGVHYPAIHTLGWYKKNLSFQKREFSCAGWLSSRTISLPLTASLSSKDVDDVIAATRKVLTWYLK